MPVPLFEPKPILVSELPSSADLGSPPVVTLTFADRAQLVIEQTKLTVGLLTLAVKAAYVLNLISGVTVMEEKWYLQRRIWAAIAGVIVFILGMFKITAPEYITAIMPDLMVQIAQGIAGLIGTVLAAWSYVKPKQ